MTALDPGPAGLESAGAAAGGARVGAARPTTETGLGPGRRWVEWALRRLTGTDRAALRLWLLTRVVVLSLVGASGWVLAPKGTAKVGSYLSRWAKWDSLHYHTIQMFGYNGSPSVGPKVPLEAFFPGFPMAMKLVNAVLTNWVISGMLISFVAGGIAIVALARLSELDYPVGTGERTVLLLLLAPSAVFLAAPYTEAMFLMFAVTAWLASRRGNWALAGLLCAGAMITRSTGIFLLVGLAVEFLTARDGRRRWSQAPWLGVSILPLVVYMMYLYTKTGDWMAWSHAQSRGWNRQLVTPWQSLAHTFEAAFFWGHNDVNNVWMMRAELIAMAVLVITCVWLLRKHKWGEATYLFMNGLALGTSTAYGSVPRSLILMFPLWVHLAHWTLRRPSLKTAYFVLIAPLMVTFTLMYSTGHWTG